jgi:DNA end-binding protein Ku
MAAMRSVSNTSLSFGLVNVPVKLYKATESHDIKFKQIHAGCGGGISLVRTCKDCSEEVAWADLAKGIDHDGELVIVEPEEIKALEGEKSPCVEVIQFMDADEVDPISYESPYYLAPDKTGVEGYALMRQALSESGKVGLVKFSLRGGRESLGVLRVSGSLMVIHTIVWPDEIREPDFAILAKPVKLKPKALEMARALISSMSEPFVPEDHVDVYTGRVEEFIAAKAAGEEFEAHPAGPEPAIDDLLAALEATIAKKKKVA